VGKVEFETTDRDRDTARVASVMQNDEYAALVHTYPHASGLDRTHGGVFLTPDECRAMARALKKLAYAHDLGRALFLVGLAVRVAAGTLGRLLIEIAR
jgi:hypothetical protein